MTLTSAAPDPESAIGAIRGFWNAYRTQYGRRPYFSWLELTKKGAIHYHAFVVNPPWTLERHARAWLRQHWPLASITPDIKRWNVKQFIAAGAKYAMAYAKKQGGKAYQQAYDNLPRSLRTFETNRLEHQVAEVDKHLDSYETVCTAAAGDPWWKQLESIWIVGRWKHVTEGRWCTLRRTC